MPHDALTPDCPKCGCNATDLVGAGSRWGKPWASFSCTYCGHEFALGNRPTASAEPAYCVEFAEQPCPYCRSQDTTVISSPRPDKGIKKRTHRCRACRRNFATRQRVNDDQATRNGHAH